MNTYAKYRLLGGAKGGGKSYACRAEAVRQCLSAPGVNGLVLRRTFPEVYNNSVFPMQRELINGFGGKKIFDYHENRHTLTFKNHPQTSMRSSITFGFCKSTKDVMRYQGIEYDFICIEELTHREYLWFRDLVSGSMRTSKPYVETNFFGSSNPGNIGHQWVKRLFIDRQFEENENPEEYAFIPANVYDNAILMMNDPDYVKSLNSLPDKLRRAYLFGDWNVFIGQYFEDFREAIHVIDPMVPRIGVKRRIICGDYGYTKPSAIYWLAEMNNGQIIVYRELYVTEHTYSQLAAKVASMTPDDEEISMVVLDPSVLGKTSETSGTTGASEFAKLNMKFTGGDNERVKGWNNFRQYLRPYVDPNTQEMTSLLKITRNCVNLIRTLPMMLHDETKVEDLNTTLEDHGPDAVRYGLLYLGEKTATMADVANINAQFITQINSKAEQNVMEWKRLSGGSGFLDVQL